MVAFDGGVFGCARVSRRGYGGKRDGVVSAVGFSPLLFLDLLFAAPRP